MQVIPVIDLLDAQVVRGVRGDRTAYRPLQSSLCDGSDPVDLARALLGELDSLPLFPARCPTLSRILYVADLGAILGRGAHAATLARLCDRLGAQYPGIEIWLDGGFADYPSMQMLLADIEGRRNGVAGKRGDAAVIPVFGTETLRSGDALRLAAAAGHAPVLSLDYRGGAALAHATAGPLEDPLNWPGRLIVMTLDQVGSYDGPDLANLERVRALAGERSIIGAGGIRDGRDLDAAARSGAAAWLVASALHDRRLAPSPGPA